MRVTLLAVVGLLAVTDCAIAGPSAAAASLKITNAHLVATCVDGKEVAARERAWEVNAPVSLTLTMKNDPRPGVGSSAPGLAVISFSPEAGHRYEVEVQATPIANSQRVWSQGKWAPVIRDRTTDRTVSSEPQWIASGCK